MYGMPRMLAKKRRLGLVSGWYHLVSSRYQGKCAYVVTTLGIAKSTMTGQSMVAGIK